MKYDPVMAGESQAVSTLRDTRKLLEQIWTQPITEPTPSDQQPETEPPQPMETGEEEKQTLVAIRPM